MNELVTNLKKLQAEKWHIQAISGSEIVATKSKPPGQGELQFYSFQLVKVSLNQAKVCVGYLQIDTDSEANMQTEKRASCRYQIDECYIAQFAASDYPPTTFRSARPKVGAGPRHPKSTVCKSLSL